MMKQFGLTIWVDQKCRQLVVAGANDRQLYLGEMPPNPKLSQWKIGMVVEFETDPVNRPGRFDLVWPIAAA